MARLPVGTAAIAAAATGLLYRSTALPSFDLGDTASFQTMVGSTVIAPRDGYPLYFALTGLVSQIAGGDAARAANLASAGAGALACGLVVLLGWELAASRLAALASALTFAGSYTFWSQTAIAEVYTLHVLLIALTLLLLLRWERRPTRRRLAWFFVALALAFGNHLTTVLLLPAFALFLLAGDRDARREVLDTRTLLLGLAVAAAGSLQYAWNLRGLWIAPVPPEGLLDALDLFWFDVTKPDWRETMVMGIHPSVLVERLRMYAFDVRQQFGWPLGLVAVAGAVHLARHDRRRLVLLGGIYVVNVLFAFGYNVGDPHVFFLPSHLTIALAVAPGGVALGRLVRGQRAVAVLLVAAAVAGIYRNYPALDRSRDMRPVHVIDALASGLDARHDLLLTGLDWQRQNGLSYYGKVVRPDLVHARVSDVLLYAPVLIADNQRIGRRVAVTETARSELEAAYGPLLRFDPDSRAAFSRLVDVARTLPPGTRYVLTVLRPVSDHAIEGADLRGLLRALTGDRADRLADRDYAVLAGRTTEAPVLTEAADRPFRRTIDLGGIRTEIRMESWLAFDTIRRMGFGHVVARRTHALIVERGVSLVALDDRGEVLRSGYQANIYAPEPRYVVTGGLPIADR